MRNGVEMEEVRRWRRGGDEEMKESRTGGEEEWRQGVEERSGV